MDDKFKDLVEKANQTFLANHNKETWFGRCIFLSWYCDVGTCNFCFRSTIKHKIRHAETAKRTISSILTDAIIGKNLGWRIEFLTGGYRIFSFEEMLDITKKVSQVYGEKIWINLGTLTEEQLLKIKPYVEGICASIETVNPVLHKEICPDKPIGPYSEMLKTADRMGFKKSMTIVIGLGESKDDFGTLAAFIREHKLDRITFYALKPVKGTPYTKSPESEEYAWWIAKTRIEFPTLEIMAGLTPQKAEDYAELILKAGATAITKFPAIKRFNSEQAKEIERQIARAGRTFRSSLTRLPDIDWGKEVDKLPFEPALKKEIRSKLLQYIDGMKAGKTTAFED